MKCTFRKLFFESIISNTKICFFSPNVSHSTYAEAHLSTIVKIFMYKVKEHKILKCETYSKMRNVQSMNKSVESSVSKVLLKVCVPSVGLLEEL